MLVRSRLLALAAALLLAPTPRGALPAREDAWRDETAARRVAAARDLLVLTFVTLGPAGEDAC